MGIPFLEKKKYYWIAAKAGDKTVLLYPPYPSENEARAKGWEKLNGAMFDVVELDTKDQSKATRAYRAKLLEQTGNLEFSVQRMKHQVDNNGIEEQK